MAVISPISAIRELTGMNRQAATIIVAGIAAFSGTAIIKSFGLDPDTSVSITVYVLLVGLALIVAANIINDPVMKKIIGYTLSVCISLFAIAIVFSVIMPDNVYIRPSYCLVRPFEQCEYVVSNVAERNKAELEASAQIPAKIEQSSSSTDANAYTVYLQFAGLITRETIIKLNKSLQSGGWKVPDVRGERTAAAAGLNEVRFRSESDRAAAQALADAITATKITSRPVKATQLSIIAEKQLEVWISN